MNWYTKDQALGYMIIGGAKEMGGLSEEVIKELIYKTEDKMETWTEEWAEQRYEKFIKG